MNGILPECLLGALFKKQQEIKIENNKFHKIFFKLKKDPEYSDLLGDIRFSGSPVSPYSEVLEEALFNFQFAGVLSRRNPDLVFYKAVENFDLSYKTLTQGLSEDTLNKLDRFSDEILRKLN